ncbi:MULTISPECIES: UDP-N-acetyl glucosamine 2-epimerase [unclassified Kitasatospora]|uniref:UDP-N-acetyl glucosamine 2-epimerase n=1 Tax=unclassified Kitasatospora TaxID=2633591 RepID=UPI00070E1BFA|nr:MULTISPECIES: UDP-N-acetylglucosamine 2-epimerase [unclassified Kitasatospora]KQV05448.1 hypothetical protein ASC99_11460 [Kitasatospora sp. Root107]KRB62254.1 hypothetical protein ASE03_06405 [Kitasatospora sp. Root187]
MTLPCLPDRSLPNFTGSRIAVVLGTRPELVKLAPLIHELGPAARLVHTGQHWDEAMSGRFLRELDLPGPELLSGVGGRPRAGQIAASLEQLDAAFTAERPGAVVVQGDTNAALAVVDHIADLLCATTEENAANLRTEALTERAIALTGNTVVEVVHRQLPDAGARAALLTRYGLRVDDYVLATVHRPENTDTAEALGAVLGELDALAAAGTAVLFPIHPRTRAAVERHGLQPLLARLTVTEPVGYGDFLGLARHAALLVSDSGGVQEECTVLGRPLLVVRPPPGSPGSPWQWPNRDGRLSDAFRRRS